MIENLVNAEELKEPHVVIRYEPFYGENMGIYLDEEGDLNQILLKSALAVEGTRIIRPKALRLSGPSYIVPSMVQIKITDACSLKCEGCYAGSGKADPSEMSIEQIIELVKRLAQWGVLSIEWVGGEVFVKKGFEKLFEYAYELGLRQILLTNAFIFGKKSKKFAENIWSYCDSIQVSLDGIGTDFDRHTRTVGAWDSVSKGIMLLSETKPAGKKLKIGTICTGKVIPGLNSIANFLSDVGGIDIWKFGKEIMGGRSSVSEGSSYDAQLKVWESIETLRKAVSNINIYHYFDKEITPPEISPEIFDDPGARTFMYILHNGEAYPRPLMSYNKKYCGGNVLNNTMEDIWFSETFQKLRSIKREMMGCGNCKKTCPQRGTDQRLNMIEKGDLLARPIPHPGCLYY